MQIRDYIKTTALTLVLGWGFGNSPAPPVASIARSGNSWPLSVSCCPWPIDCHRHGVNAHARHRHAAVWLPRGWYHAGAGFAIPACDGAQQMTRDPAREERQTRHSDRETEMQPSPCQKRDVVAAVPSNGAPARRRHAGLLSFARRCPLLQLRRSAWWRLRGPAVEGGRKPSLIWTVACRSVRN